VAEWEKPAGLPIGTAAPGFELSDLDGSSVTLEALTESGRPAVLFFTHPECDPCSRLLPKLAYWQDALGERLTIAVLSQGGAEANAPLKEELELSNVLLELRAEVYESYRIRGTPSAVVVGPDRNIASDTATGEFVIEEVLRLSVHRSGIAAAVAA
jgi:thiol-disulfide isomerase/thioredoxin